MGINELYVHYYCSSIFFAYFFGLFFLLIYYCTFIFYSFYSSLIIVHGCSH